MLLAEVALQNGNVDTAQEQLQAVIKAVPETYLAAQAQLQRAQVYLRADDPVTARAALDLVIEKYPVPLLPFKPSR